MLTRNGIQLDLKSSNYLYELDHIVFYFSSELYLNKFKNELPEYSYSESIKLKNKYKLNLSCKIFLAISLYRKIEKRGFYILDKLNNKTIKENSLFYVKI